MDPQYEDLYRRLEVIERRQIISDERDRVADERSKTMEQKLDTLLAFATAGRTVWWIFSRIGSAIVVLGSGFAWAADHFRWFVR